MSGESFKTRKVSQNIIPTVQNNSLTLFNMRVTCTVYVNKNKVMYLHNAVFARVHVRKMTLTIIFCFSVTAVLIKCRRDNRFLIVVEKKINNINNQVA